MTQEVTVGSVRGALAGPCALLSLGRSQNKVSSCSRNRKGLYGLARCGGACVGCPALAGSLCVYDGTVTSSASAATLDLSYRAHC